MLTAAGAMLKIACMMQTYVRNAGVAEPAPGREEQIAHLRAKLARFDSDHAPLPVDKQITMPVGLAKLLPGGGLARGVAYSFSASSLLMSEVIAHVSGEGGVVGVVGWPEFGYAAVAETGGNLDHVVAVPDPGLEPLAAVSVLVEGLDLVVYRGPALALSPTRARPLLAKLRAGRATLAMIGTQVPSPAAYVEARLAAVSGIGAGTGRIRSLELAVQVRAKGHERRGAVIVGKQPPQPRQRLRAV